MSNQIYAFLVHYLKIITYVLDAGTKMSFGREDCATVLTSAVETMAQIVENFAIGVSESEEQVLTQRISLVLGVMVAIARVVPDVHNSKQEAQARCISCLQTFLESTHPTVRIFFTSWIMFD